MSATNSLLHRFSVYESIIPTSFRLSVLVPIYNERHVVEASLRRVLALEHALINGLEVIVVDDGSTDGTGEILQRLADGY
jgi:glycosyltransferase involved in cell wall biosynthesis